MLKKNMLSNYNNVHLKFQLNGIHYSYKNLMEVAYRFVEQGLLYEKVIGNFLLNWLDNKNYIQVNTSGSTGKPKLIKVKKQAMVNSAIATGIFFKLKPGDSVLHCLPTKFIAGKMMLVRAIILGLEIDIIEPKLKPSFNTNKKYHFTAMIPTQLKNALKHCGNIKTIIVGGAPVLCSLRKDIQNLNSNVFETYGMTETLTHIAVKNINNTANMGSKLSKKHCFQTLPKVSVSQDERDCLIIDAPQIADGKIVTNDIVKLHSQTEFEWLGRYDNVINSAGIKLYPEQIEAKIQSKISSRFFISSIPDETYGEKVVLVVEGNSNVLDGSIFSELTTYQTPKHIYTIPKFIETGSGKVQRNKTLSSIS